MFLTVSLYLKINKQEIRIRISLVDIFIKEFDSYDCISLEDVLNFKRILISITDKTIR